MPIGFQRIESNTSCFWYQWINAMKENCQFGRNSMHSVAFISARSVALNDDNGISKEMNMCWAATRSG